MQLEIISNCRYHHKSSLGLFDEFRLGARQAIEFYCIMQTDTGLGHRLVTA